jgi:hypothetical protein
LKDAPEPIPRIEGPVDLEMPHIAHEGVATVGAKAKLCHTVGEPRCNYFVPGINWAYDLRSMPMGLANIVFASCVPRQGNDWPDVFGNWSRTVPVFVGEFAGQC